MADQHQKAMTTPHPPSSTPSTPAIAAQERARSLFRTYHHQFTQGCGHSDCPSLNCASNPSFTPLTVQQASQRAIEAVKNEGDSRLCPNLRAAASHPSPASAPSPSLASTASTTSSGGGASPSPSPLTPLPAHGPAFGSSLSAPSLTSVPPSAAPTAAPIPPVVAASASTTSSSAPMDVSTTPVASPTPPARALAPPTTSSTAPQRSASPTPSSPSRPAVGIQYSDLLSLWNVANGQLTSATPSPSLTSAPFSPLIRLVGQVFADLQSLSASFTEADASGGTLPPTGTDPAIDWEQVDQAFTLLLGSELLSAPLLSAIRRLITPLTSYPMASFSLPHLRALFLLMECPSWLDPEHSDTFKLMLKGLGSVKGDCRATLVEWYATYSSERLSTLLSTIQQYITVRWYMMSRLEDVTYAVEVVGLLHAANAKHAAQDLPHLPVSAFYNDAVNTELDLKSDYRHWRAPVTSNAFSFAAHPYILDPASKARLLQIDATQQMHREAQAAYIQSFFQRTSPYLVLRVHRTNLIQDTLRQLSMYGSEDYKKPLKVQFVGEQGIDEGGVRKEFFQLLVTQLFDPAYGMFSADEETRTFHFNPLSLESTLEFELIGIVLGLALYNSIILDVRFPFAVYKKLLGLPVGWADLVQYNPSLARGLKKLEQDESAEVEEVYAQTFTVDVDVFGEKKTEELKAGGKDVPLTSANRLEYIQLYVDWVLNRSVARQFTAFKKGFDLCVPPSSLALFVPEELELLICGSEELDFGALKAATVYDDGYDEGSEVVQWFWEVLDELDDKGKKKLLMFCTGSDRVPIRGLGSMRFTISKNGPDSDLLPTSHTCFNHLLLPAYATKAKLKRYLELALENSQGFGLI